VTAMEAKFKEAGDGVDSCVKLVSLRD